MKKRISGKRSVWLVMLAAIMLIAAGCQAVGGLDLNKTLKQAFQVNAYEGSQTIELKLQFAEDALRGAPADETALMRMLSNMKLQLDDIKMKDADHLSVSGLLALDNKQIGFSIAMDNKLAVLQLDGAKAPIVLELSDDGSLMEGLSQESITAASKQMVEAVANYAIDNLPNPSKITAASVQETVLGESLSLMHVQAELSGKEIWTWISSYLEALLKDEQGLKKTLTTIYELVQSQTPTIEAVGGDNIFGTLLDEDSDEAVADAFDYFLEGLRQMKDGMKEIEQDPESGFDKIFNPNTYAKADVYVDSSLNIRKAIMEAAIVPSLEQEEIDSEFPLQAIHFRSITERKNINGEVTTDKVTRPGNGLNLERLAEMEGYEILQQFDPKSAIYKLLRNDMHITRQQIYMHPEYSYVPPVVLPSGITLVPLRDTAERLGASLKATAKAKKITVHDPATATTIQLAKGSDQVYVNGKKQKWSFPVTVINGVTYVPGRDFAKALGGKIYWENVTYDWETGNYDKYLILQREP
ncbi:copper amine oxidase N-terminal domain-containing protein [Paenibacillus sp. GCM10027626]|uniref:copper amine oxidase N-terminal domain-containing protein n=1 Tax=Paenibacillus sp. GCM10027626 TaxID=3273411 RepID=UPI003635435C